MLLLYRLVLHVCDSVIDLQTQKVKVKSICNEQRRCNSTQVSYRKTWRSDRVWHFMIPNVTKIKDLRSFTVSGSLVRVLGATVHSCCDLHTRTMCDLIKLNHQINQLLRDWATVATACCAQPLPAGDLLRPLRHWHINILAPDPSITTRRWRCGESIASMFVITCKLAWRVSNMDTIEV